MGTRRSLEFFFREKLPNLIPNYEKREGQMQMAHTIEECLFRKKNLFVEAGTGIGKSLGYLLPLILYAKREGKRVSVATYTKILQEQLIKKDIPIVQNLFPFRAAVAYGSENYICQRRLRSSLNYRLFETEEEKYLREKVLGWSEAKKGLVLDFPETLPPFLPSKINRSRENCQGKRCPYFAECFYHLAKKEWEAADLLVINHSLFFAHCAASYRLLPEFEAILFDEAHRLEEAAVGYFGIDLSNFGLRRTFHLLYQPKRERGLLVQLPLPSSQREELKRKVRELLSSLDNFFFEVREKLEPRKRILSPPSLASNFLFLLEDFNFSLAKIWRLSWNCLG